MPRMDPLEAARRTLQGGDPVALLEVAEVSGDPPSRAGLKLTVLQDGTSFGTLGCDGFDEAGRKDGLKALDEGQGFRSRYRWDKDSSIEVAIKPLSPGDVVPDAPHEIPELLVVGTGPVARSLATLGESMGYHVRVAAGPHPPSVGEFGSADELIVTSDALQVIALRPGKETFVVICGHDRDFSQEVLRGLLKDSAAPYIGMMGSRRHTGTLYETLQKEGFSKGEIARVHTPVGLDLGAETPEEIALSALAQIVAFRRGGQGGHLHER